MRKVDVGSGFRESGGVTSEHEWDGDDGCSRRLCCGTIFAAVSAEGRLVCGAKAAWEPWPDGHARCLPAFLEAVLRVEHVAFDGLST